MALEQKERRRLKNGRRDYDNQTCPFHKIHCREIKELKKSGQGFATKEEVNQMQDEMNKRLPIWIFRLFVTTFIPASFIILGWIGYQTLRGNEIATRLDTNQRVIMKAFDLEPKK